MDEEILKDMEEGSVDEDVYTEEGLEELEENDEIDEVEEGFCEGYKGKDDSAECAYCHQILVDEDFVEIEIEGIKHRFCCQDCCDEYLKKKQ